MDMKKRSIWKMGNLLPIMNPLFNLREIVKQMALLEDHLNNARKRCPDCIRKHFLTIEAFFEETISLDKKFQYVGLLEGKADLMRDLQGCWLDLKDTEQSQIAYLVISQVLRKIRKEFAPLCFDVRKMANIERRASLYVCPHRRVATLSPQEKEIRETERLVRKKPKIKPPRKDLMRKRIQEEDPDLQYMGGGAGGDRDLSLNHKRVARHREGEGSHFTHEGRRYDLNSVLSSVEKNPIKKISVGEIDWVLDFGDTDPIQVRKADVSVPILVAPSKSGLPTVVDGLHRLQKAKDLGLEYLTYRYVSELVLKSSEI
jgi:hypothetical protein